MSFGFTAAERLLSFQITLKQPVRPVRAQTNAWLFRPLLINENITLVERGPAHAAVAPGDGSPTVAEAISIIE